MAEDLKVSEFESGTDRRMYHTHRNLQQAHGPEANFHYRAESGSLSDTVSPACRPG